MERLEQSAGLDRALEACPTAKALQERARRRRRAHLAGARGAARLHQARAPARAGRVRRARRSVPPRRRSSTTSRPTLRTRLRRRRSRRTRCGARSSPPWSPTRWSTAPASASCRACSDETGAALPALARAHVVARDVFDAGTTWAAIDALDLAVPAAVQDDDVPRRPAPGRTRRALAGASRRRRSALGPTVDRFRPGVQAVVAALPDARRGAAAPAGQSERAVARRRRPGAGSRSASSDAAVAALPAVELGARRGVDPRDGRAAAVRARRPARASTGSATASPRCRAATAGRPRPAPRSATTSTSRSTRSPTPCSARPTPTSPPDARVDAWIAAHRAAVERYRDARGRHRARPASFDLATLAVVRRALRELADLD